MTLHFTVVGNSHLPRILSHIFFLEMPIDTDDETKMKGKS
jgi:hypothetical protein